MVDVLTRNWGWVALRGAAALLFGLLTIFNPALTLAVLVLLFGLYALLDGVFLVVAALGNRRGEPRWVALLLGGLLGIAAGIATFVVPDITAVALLAVIAVWSILVGVAEIAAAIKLRKVITGEWLLVFAGVLAIALGVFLVAAPEQGALAVVLWIGACAVASGLIRIALGFRLRSWGREHGAGPVPRAA